MKINTLLLLVVFCLSLMADNTIVGVNALKNSAETYNATAVGENAATGATDNDYCIFLGKSAGEKSESLKGCIAIGKGALRATKNTNGTVAIGEDELANETYMDDTTSINEKQLWISKPLSAFCINPGKETHITNTPLYYLDGTLYVNAPIVSGDDMLNYAATGNKYDMYLSPAGDDANNGFSPLQAKRTIAGCYTAATNGMRIGVYPGDYLPPSNNEPSGSQPLLIATGKALEFVAIGGKDKTSITGVYENDNIYSNGFHHTLAFETGPQIFRGFTIRNLSGYRKSLGGATRTHAPVASCVSFIDCAIENDILRFSFYFGGFNTCSFEDTTITIDKVEYYESFATNFGGLFLGCDMNNCKVSISDAEGLIINGAYGQYDFFQGGNFSGTLFLLPPLKDQYERTFKNSPAFKNCTFIYDVILAGRELTRVSPNNATNCYFAVSTGWSYGSTIKNAFAPSWTNTYLNAEYIPSSIDCPAVRDDGRDDAGWKDSGLKLQKALNLRADIRLEDGLLKVYTNGVEIGSISLNIN